MADLLLGMQLSPLSHCIRASVRLFHHEVTVVQQLSAPADWELSLDLISRPQGRPEPGSPRFSLLFDDLHWQIGFDVAQLEEDGYRVRRPCVCLVSNGFADDDWTADHEQLIDYDEERGTGFRERPDVVALPGCAVRKGAPLDLPALRSMVMPRRRSGVLEYEHDIDINSVVAVLVGRSRPLVTP